MANADSRSIAILGAGVTGLTAAHRLVRRGHRVRVFEATHRVGGAIRTELADGWLVEAGPNTILAGDPALAALLDELGLASEVLRAGPAAKNRYIIRGGVPMAAPLSPPALLTSRLFSPAARIRLLAETLSRRRTRTADLSLEEFMRGHFSQELIDYGLNPFVTGIYAGDPKKLSARHAFPNLWKAEQTHGSLLRAQKAAAAARRKRGAASGIFSFRRGLQTLTDTLAARLPPGALVLDTRIEALVPRSPSAGSARASTAASVPATTRPTAAGSAAPEATTAGSETTAPAWSVVRHGPAGAIAEPFDAVIVALPGPALARLRLGAEGAQSLATLDAIEHPPVSSLFLGYRRDQVAHPLDGFGVLVPEIERRAFLGVLFSSTLFPDRAPADHIALTILAGGTRDPDIARLPADRLLAAVAPDLGPLLGVRGAPVFQHHTFWPRAIPQYNLGYEAHLAAIAAAERAHPGLFIGGQVRDGISLPACIAAGERLAACIS